jgi:hypothetical protein
MDGQHAEVGDGDAITKRAVAGIVKKEHFGKLEPGGHRQIGKVSILVTGKDFLMGKYRTR